MKDSTFGLKVLAGFFAFGACMCALTVFLLLFPGTVLDALWTLNPEARRGFQWLGKLSTVLMVVVGSSCALAGIGLARNARWAVQLAIAILTVNLIADVLNALISHDYRTLIGLPIGGAMILYLVFWHSKSRRD